MGAFGACGRVDVDERIGRIARRQHGCFATGQAQRIGVTLAHIERRIRRGSLVRLRRGVYAVNGAPVTQHQAVMAAVLAAGERVVASHDTALWVWGLRRSSPEQIEVSSHRGRKVRHRGVRAHRSGVLLGLETARRDRIPVTSVARTVVDVSDRYTDGELGAIVDDALRRRVLRLADLCFVAASLRNSTGRSLARVRRVLAARRPGYEPTDSELEARVLRVIVEAGLPEPRRQWRVRIDGRTKRVDFAYPQRKVTIECDSWRYHGQRTPFDDDLARGNELVALGYRHLRFTSRHSDAHIARAVRNALALDAEAESGTDAGLVQ